MKKTTTLLHSLVFFIATLGLVTSAYSQNTAGTPIQGTDVGLDHDREEAKTEGKGTTEPTFSSGDSKRATIKLQFTNGHYWQSPTGKGDPSSSSCMGSGICFGGGGKQKMNPFHVTNDLGTKLNDREVIGAFTLKDNVLEVELLTAPVEKSKNFIVSKNIELDPSICKLLGVLPPFDIDSGDYAISYTTNPFGSIKLKTSKGQKTVTIIGKRFEMYSNKSSEATAYYNNPELIIKDSLTGKGLAKTTLGSGGIFKFVTLRYPSRSIIIEPNNPPPAMCNCCGGFTFAPLPQDHNTLSTVYVEDPELVLPWYFGFKPGCSMSGWELICVKPDWINPDNCTFPPCPWEKDVLDVFAKLDQLVASAKEHSPNQKRLSDEARVKMKNAKVPDLIIEKITNGDQTYTGACDGEGTCDNNMYLYQKEEKLQKGEAVINFKLTGGFLNGEFLMKSSEKMDAKVFTITKEITLNKEICGKLGVKSLTILPGKYAIDRSANKLGSLKLKTSTGEDKKKIAFSWKDDYHVDNQDILNYLGTQELIIKKGEYLFDYSINPNGDVVLPLAKQIQDNGKEKKAMVFEGIPANVDCNNDGNSCVGGPRSTAKNLSFYTVKTITEKGFITQIVLSYKGKRESSSVGTQTNNNASGIVTIPTSTTGPTFPPMLTGKVITVDTKAKTYTVAIEGKKYTVHYTDLPPIPGSIEQYSESSAAQLARGGSGCERCKEACLGGVCFFGPSGYCRCYMKILK